MSLNKTQEKEYLKFKSSFNSLLNKEFSNSDIRFIEESHEYFYTNEDKIFETFNKEELNNLKKINYLKYENNKYILKLNALSNILHGLSSDFKTNVVISRVIFKNMLNNLVQAKKLNNVVFLTEMISQVIKNIHKKNNNELKFKNIADQEKTLYDIEGQFSKYKLFSDIFGFTLENKDLLNELTKEEAVVKITDYINNNFEENDIDRFFEIKDKLQKLDVFPQNYLTSKSFLENRELISNSWALTNLTATEKGTIVHLILEDELNGERKDKNGDLKEYLKLIKKDDISIKLKLHPNYNFINDDVLKKDANEVARNAIKLIKNSLFNIESIVSKLHDAGWYPITTEFRAWDISKCLAGTMDILLYNVKTNTLCIGDWKTNKKLNEINPFQNMNLKGLNIQDTNLKHYSFQLSTYFTMLKNNTNVLNFLHQNKVNLNDKHLILHVTQDTNENYLTMTNKLIEEHQFSSDEAGKIVLDMANDYIQDKIKKIGSLSIKSPTPNIEIIKLFDLNTNTKKEEMELSR